jgi:hypothetical protein
MLINHVVRGSGDVGSDVPTLVAQCPRSLEVRDVLPLSALDKILEAGWREPRWQGRSRRVN